MNCENDCLLYHGCYKISSGCYLAHELNHQRAHGGSQSPNELKGAGPYWDKESYFELVSRIEAMSINCGCPTLIFETLNSARNHEYFMNTK